MLANLRYVSVAIQLAVYIAMEMSAKTETTPTYICRSVGLHNHAYGNIIDAIVGDNERFCKRDVLFFIEEVVGASVPMKLAITSSSLPTIL